MYRYLFIIQFLGFRYSGWQKQPGQKTIESMLQKTLQFVLPDREFKILGAGRTDAKVSALAAAFELFLEDHPLDNADQFIENFNSNLPPDIKALKCIEVNKKFNIIKDCLEKEYIYFFSHGTKNHPFSAPYITAVQEKLDIDLMRTGASLFIGEHNFKAYTTRDKEKSQFHRTIISCEIMENDLLKANFFPDESYMLKIKANGFMRYQVRMIMAVLFKLGKKQTDLAEIKASLEPGYKKLLTDVAPGSGLILRSLNFSIDT